MSWLASIPWDTSMSLRRAEQLAQKTNPFGRQTVEHPIKWNAMWQTRVNPRRHRPRVNKGDMERLGIRRWDFDFSDSPLYPLLTHVTDDFD